jgi:hypothetical protein
MFRRTSVVAAAPMLSAGVALAASPHFISSSDSIDGDGNLLVKFKEAGLGNSPVTST